MSEVLSPEPIFEAADVAKSFKDRQRKTKPKLATHEAAAKLLEKNEKDDGLLDEPAEAGWVIKKSSKSGVLLERNKKASELLEDRAWCLMKKLGFKAFSPPHDDANPFKLPFKGHDLGKPRQIDVFAKDDDCFVVIECKFRNHNKNLDLTLDQHSVRNHEITESVRKYYNNPNLKPIFLLVTEGIEWSDSRLAYAHSRGYDVIDETQMMYYEEVAGALGQYARTQFIGEFLAGKPIGAGGYLKIEALRTKDGAHPEYVAKISARQLHQISFISHRKMRERGESINYQRIMSKKRLEEIKAFVDGGGTFPNNITLSLRHSEEHRAIFEQLGDSNFGILSLPLIYRILHIIDGQHRTLGSAASINPDMELIVSVNVGLDAEAEAQIFSDVNNRQKNVSRALLTELNGVMNLTSDDCRKRLDAMGAHFAQRLSTLSKSPYYNAKRPLAVAEISNALIKSGLIGSFSSKTNNVDPGIFTGETVHETLDNASLFFFEYFDHIRVSVPALWAYKHTKKGHGLPQSNVFIIGHIGFVSMVVDFLMKKGIDVKKMKWRDQLVAIKPYLDAFLRLIGDMQPDTYMDEFLANYGSGGNGEMKWKIAAGVRRVDPTFDWDELTAWIAKSAQLQPLLQKADALTAQITKTVVDYIDNTHGSEFWKEDSVLAPENLVRALVKRSNAAGKDGNTDLRQHFKFADIGAYLIEDRLFKKVDFLQITTNYRGNKSDKTIWLSALATLVQSRQASNITDLFALVERVEAFFAAYNAEIATDLTAAA